MISATDILVLGGPSSLLSPESFVVAISDDAPLFREVSSACGTYPLRVVAEDNLEWHGEDSGVSDEKLLKLSEYLCARQFGLESGRYGAGCIGGARRFDRCRSEPLDSSKDLGDGSSHTCDPFIVGLELSPVVDGVKI